MAKWNPRLLGVALLNGVAAGSLAACGGGSSGPLTSIPPVTAGRPSTPLPTPSASPAPQPAPSPAPQTDQSPIPTPEPTPPPSVTSGAGTSSAQLPCGASCTGVAPPEGFVITPSAMQPQRSVQDDAEYRRNYLVAEYINALFALEHNWVGQGVRVGVMDDGVNAIGDLEGKVDVGLSRDFGFLETNGVRTSRGGSSRIGDETSTHGTPVAAIIAARDDGLGVQGLAPGATIVSLRVDSVVDGEKSWGAGRDLALRHAADSGIPLVNMSLVLRAGSRPSSAFMDALAYYNRRERGLLIAATGNSSLPTTPSAVEVDPAFAESWLFVAALESDGFDYELAGYSNRCGSVMNRCVVAPTLSNTMGATGRSQRFGGTSSATPVVTSVAAMILSRWPQLTGVDAGNIILNTARDLGEPGTDPIYGRGLVDAEAALRPVNPMLSNSSAIGPLDNTVLVLGDAFGVVTGASLDDALGNVTVLDQYGRDFAGDLSGLVIRPAAADNPEMLRRVEAQMNARTASSASRQGSAMVGVTGFDTGLRDSGGVPVLRSELTNAEVAVRLSDRMSLTAGFNSQNNVSADIFGLAPTSDAVFAYSPLAQNSFGISHKLGKGKLLLSAYTGSQDDIEVNGATVQFRQGATSLKLGLVDEAGSVFGTPVGIGILRFGDGARTIFLEAASGFDLGKWRLDGYAGLGGTRLRIGNDLLLTHAGMIASGRFGLIASRPALNGRLSLGVAQQLVVVDGNATFTVGNGYDLDARSLLFQDRRVDLSGEIIPQFTIGYEKMGRRSDFRLGGAMDHLGRDVRAVASWSLKFGGQIP